MKLVAAAALAMIALALPTAGADLVAVGYDEDAEGDAVAFSGKGNATSQWLALSIDGDARSNFAASVTGNSTTGPWVAISVFGNASSNSGCLLYGCYSFSGTGYAGFSGCDTAWYFLGTQDFCWHPGPLLP